MSLIFGEFLGIKCAFLYTVAVPFPNSSVGSVRASKN